MKIKDVRTSKIKLVEHLGEVEPAWTPGTASITSTLGGYDFTEIELDSGEIGIGPGCDKITIKDSKELSDDTEASLKKSIDEFNKNNKFE